MRNFKTVDVFTSTPFHGNPLAVVLEADGLSDAEMHAIAAWTNLSETTFHLKPTTPGADYRVRIMTPRSELPFAGHPTIGTAHALLEAGLVEPRNGELVQECKVGLVPVTVQEEDGVKRLKFRMPEARITDLSVEAALRLVAVLGETQVAPESVPALVNVGARWLIVELENAEAVLALKPDLAAMAEVEQALGGSGVTVYGKYGSGPAAIEVRSFAPSDGVPEDPVCGSGNGAVAAYRLARGQVSDPGAYLSSQGQCVGRTGRISLTLENGAVYVAGAAVTTVNGTIEA